MGAEHRKLGVPGRGGAGQRPRRLLLRHLRRRVLQGQGDDHRRRRRLGDGGGHLPRQVRLQRDDRAPPRRVPRVADHVRPRARTTENIELLTPYVVEEFLPGEGGAARLRAREATSRPARSASCRWPARSSPSGTCRSPSSSTASSTPTRTATSSSTAARRRTNVPGIFAGRRPRRPHLPPGDHRRRLGLPVRARRRVVPARQPARADAGRARGHRRPRRGAVVPPRARRAAASARGRLSAARSV